MELTPEEKLELLKQIEIKLFGAKKTYHKISSDDIDYQKQCDKMYYEFIKSANKYGGD